MLQGETSSYGGEIPTLSRGNKHEIDEKMAERPFSGTQTIITKFAFKFK